MDPLTQLLMQRSMASPQTMPQPQPAMAQIPVVPPSGGHTNTPPEAQRFKNAQNMMQNIRNGWSPNPVIADAAAPNR